MVRYWLSAAPQSDILDILAWSQAQFGDAARTRYEVLIVAALRDITAQPDRPGSIECPELGAVSRSWHLCLSRERAHTKTGMVRHARHFLVYRVEPDLFVIGRALHEAMELTRHLDPERSWR